jgi:hypothetical protein
MSQAGLCARFAAGRTFTARTLAAGWGYRYQHASVVDAAAAIYVIGGYGKQDVWASTDGGAPGRTASEGAGTGGYYGGTTGVLEEYSGVLKVYDRGTMGVLGVLRGYSRGP